MEAAFGIKVGLEFPSQPLNTLCLDLIWMLMTAKGAKILFSPVLSAVLVFSHHWRLVVYCGLDAEMFLWFVPSESLHLLDWDI